MNFIWEMTKVNKSKIPEQSEGILNHWGSIYVRCNE